MYSYIKAVDTVGQAGRPKTITGFQTHNTPVLMAHTERAELGSEECTFFEIISLSHIFPDLSLSHILEGFVILKKNPEYVSDVEMATK